MSEDPLKNWYTEEKSLYDQLMLIQKLIKLKGGTPKCDVLGAISFHDFVDTTACNDIVKIEDTNTPAGYNPYMSWEEKTRFAIERLGKNFNVAEIIKYLSRIDPNTDKKKLPGNVYNAVSRLKNHIEKDERTGLIIGISPMM